MSQRTALAIAAALTAFLLVIGGGVASRLTQQEPAEAAAQPAPTLTSDREAAYQQALDEANARIAQANAQIAEANARLQPAAQAPAVASQALTPQQAGAIVLSLNPGAAILRDPELVDFQGATAYEVTLDTGTAYIDAQSGAVLLNSTAAGLGGAGREHEDEEHEDEEHEEREEREEHEDDD